MTHPLFTSLKRSLNPTKMKLLSFRSSLYMLWKAWTNRKTRTYISIISNILFRTLSVTTWNSYFPVVHNLVRFGRVTVGIHASGETGSTKLSCNLSKNSVYSILLTLFCFLESFAVKRLSAWMGLSDNRKGVARHFAHCSWEEYLACARSGKISDQGRSDWERSSSGESD